MPKDDIKSLLGEAKAELKGVVRPRQPTVTDGVLQPADDSAPGAGRQAVVPRPRPRVGPSEATVIVPEAEFDPREADTVPARRRAQPQLELPSLPPPAEVPAMTPSVMASVARVPLGRLLVVIAASGAAITGVVAAIGAAAVNVIVALRPPANVVVMQEIEALKTRANGDFGLKLETQTRQEKDAELEKKLEKVDQRLNAITNALPTKVKVKVNPETE